MFGDFYKPEPIDGFPYVHIPNYGQENIMKPFYDYAPDVETLLFKQIDKPKNFLFLKAINVYDDKFRINVYTKEYVDDIESKRITFSCFAQYDNNKLTILDSGAAVSAYSVRSPQC